MKDEILKFLADLPPFARLPEKDLAQAVEQASVQAFPKKTILSVQGRTTLKHVYIVKEGSLELFYETENEKTLSGFLKPGEIFGGIYILMNAGLSVRTVQTVDDVTLYTLPQDVFLDLCKRHDFFYDFFAEKFRDRMSNEAYASVATSGQIQHFLSRLVPFSFLPEEEIDGVTNPLELIARLSYQLWTGYYDIALEYDVEPGFFTTGYVKYAQDYFVDGIMVHPLRSCRAATYHLIHTKNMMLEKMKVPGVIIDGDIVDLRVFNEEEALSKVEAFLETMEHYREVRKREGFS